MDMGKLYTETNGLLLKSKIGMYCNIECISEAIVLKFTIFLIYITTNFTMPTFKIKTTCLSQLNVPYYNCLEDSYKTEIIEIS